MSFDPRPRFVLPPLVVPLVVPPAPVAAGKPPAAKEEFVFFWGRRHPFSQWHLRSFEVDGVVFNCGEQAMMAGKAALFGDEATRRAIMAEKDPERQKRLGRAVTPFDEETWVRERVPLVIRNNLAKFSQNPDLALLIAETEGKTLVEASPYDGIWGIRLGADHPDAGVRSRWRGLNLLGDDVLTDAVRPEIVRMIAAGEIAVPGRRL